MGNLSIIKFIRIDSMRLAFREAYEDMEHFQSHRELLKLNPISAQECFFEVVGNIVMCNKKQQLDNLIPLLNMYRGSYSAFSLSCKYATYCMENQVAANYQHFTILNLLSKWVEVLEATKKKKDIRLYSIVVENLQTGVVTFEEFLVYLNYISLDLTGLIKLGTEQSRRKYHDQTNSPHLNTQDLLKFVKAVLPKTLSNIIIPRTFFPATLLKTTEESIDILYSNQTLETTAQTKTNYILLVKTILKMLLSMELQSNEVKELVLSAFKYYYLYHWDKVHAASQIVIESLKKMSSAVRYAMSEDIAFFIITLKKLGKELFISYLTEKFDWISEVAKIDGARGIKKSAIKPFHSLAINNSLQIKIDARKIEYRYIEVYDRFSLLYFCINCLEYDISIRFYYLGEFNKPETMDDKRLLFISEKKQGVFEGSIEVIEKGIYMFQFDNSYSWMKSKTVTYDTVVFVPLEIKQQMQDEIKSLVFEKEEYLNQVPVDNIIGWVDENEIKLTSTSANVSYSVEYNLKVYNLKMVKNSGHVYEYETESKSRFSNKVQEVSKNPNIFWLIEGYKINRVELVEEWLNGEYEPEKLADIEQTMEAPAEIKEKENAEVEKKRSIQLESKIEPVRESEFDAQNSTGQNKVPHFSSNPESEKVEQESLASRNIEGSDRGNEQTNQTMKTEQKQGEAGNEKGEGEEDGADMQKLSGQKQQKQEEQDQPEDNPQQESEKAKQNKQEQVQIVDGLSE